MITIRTPDQDPTTYMPEGGVYLVDKPLGWTSFDVVNKIRFHLGRRLGEKRPKVGHAGTLDPLATGLLVLCVGSHTKLISGLQAEEKLYEGHFVLGATTASYDRETETEHWLSTDHITAEMLEAARLQFMGKLDQYPPMYSAVKVDGQKLYDLARAGKALDLATRPVEILEFTLGQAEIIIPGQEQEVLLKPTVRYYPEERGLRVPFRVRCTKGTYIRSLAYDFGKVLGCGGHLGSLRRTGSGAFDLKDAFTVENWVK
jgi:tRNA pseudouridine55 synthase